MFLHPYVLVPLCLRPYVGFRSSMDFRSRRSKGYLSSGSVTYGEGMSDAPAAGAVPPA